MLLTAPGTRAVIPWARILPLAFSQLVAWGVFYYAFAVIVGPMGIETGWTKPQMNGALSVGLGVSGLSAFPVGRWIDRHGGQRLMTTGAILGASALLMWSQVTALWQLYAVWVLIGAVCSMTLYEAAFAVTAHLVPGGYRRAITAITLVAGLASTAFIPLTHWLTETFGWRETLIILAGIELVICASIPWLVLPNSPDVGPTRNSRGTVPRMAVFSRVRLNPIFWLLLASYVSFAFFFSSMVFNLLPLLVDKGFGMAGAVALYSIIGPAQVAGRLVIFAIDRTLPVALAGIAATVLPIAAMFILIGASRDSGLWYLFPVLFGVGMGIKTVVQATAAPDFLGVQEYGALQGLIATPVQIVQAASPFVAALVWSWADGFELLQWLLLLSVCFSAVTFAAAAMAAGKRRH